MQFTTGYDTLLQPPFLDGAVGLTVEYFRNTAATGAVPAAPPDRLTSRRHHLWGFSAGYDLGFLWRLQGTMLLDTETGSHVLVPGLTWSAAQDVDVQFLT